VYTTVADVCQISVKFGQISDINMTPIIFTGWWH